MSGAWQPLGDHRVSLVEGLKVVLTSRFAHQIALTGYFGLLSLLMLWPTVLSPPQRVPVALILAVSLLPLLFPLRGLLYGRPSACTWAAYLSLFYFIHGVTDIAGNLGNQRIPGGLEVLASLMLFFGCAFYLKSLKS